MRFLLLVLSLPLSLSLSFPQDVPHRTTTTDKAIDAIARNITRAGGRISVCWLLDASPSMADDRAVVAKKIDSIFADLPKSATISMTVVGFDDKPKKYGDLTDVRDDVRAAIGKIGAKGSGKENVCAAIDAAARLLHGEGQTRAIILITDESGDDAEKLEATINRVKEEGVQVHIVGREARFGWTQSYEHDGRWWVPVLAGPESAAQEVMHRNPICCYQEEYPRCLKRLVDSGAKTEEFQADDPLGCDLGPGYVVTAGYGPCALERLAKESGGSFTIMGGKPTYDPKAMEGYEPELITVELWKERNGKSPMRRALLTMFEERVKARDMGLRATFGKGECEGLAGKAKKAEAQVDQWIAALVKARKDAGEPTADKTGKIYKRWYANVDLAIAQLRALAHAIEQYRMLMEEIASGKRAVGPNPLYLVKAAPREAKRRAAAIEECIFIDKTHPGTPWAWTARWIASRLGGFDVVEAKPPIGNRPNPGPTPPAPPPPKEK